MCIENDGLTAILGCLAACWGAKRAKLKRTPTDGRLLAKTSDRNIQRRGFFGAGKVLWCKMDTAPQILCTGGEDFYARGELGCIRARHHTLPKTGACH